MIEYLSRISTVAGYDTTHKSGFCLWTTLSLGKGGFDYYGRISKANPLGLLTYYLLTAAMSQALLTSTDYSS